MRRWLYQLRVWVRKQMYIPQEWALPIIGEEEYETLLELERQCFEGAT